MLKLASLSGAVFGLIALGAVGSALAMPLPAAPVDTPAAAQLVEQIHGCHHGILRDRRAFATYGWHFHDRACVRQDTAPPGWANGPGSRGSHIVPLCRYRCTFKGPVKMCEQVCR